MPIIALEVPETYDNITRPVTTEVVRDLKVRLQLPADTSLLFQGSAEVSAQRGSTIDGQEDQAFPFHDRVKVELEEIYIEDGMLTTAIRRNDNLIIFADPKLNVYMRPVYTKTETTIQFQYRTNSKLKALKWRDAIRRRTSEGKGVLLHEFNYHYSAPDVFHVILKEIYDKREAVAGYNETFAEWLVEHYTDRMTVITNLNGTQGITAIPEKQINVQGWFDFTAEPQSPSKERDGENWEVSFSYIFQYDKVTAMVMEYPISIHNQLIDHKFLPTTKPYDPYKVGRRPSMSGALNDYFSAISRDRGMMFEGVVIPDFDDWKPKGYKLKTFDIVSTLIGVDLREPTLIVNLRELGSVIIHEDILTFLSQYSNALTTYLRSIFFIGFFKGETLQSSTSITVDSDLNVWSTVPMDPRDLHHLKFTIVYDLKNLSKEAIDALRNNPDVCKKIVDLIDALQRPKVPIGQGSGNGNGWKSDEYSRPGFNSPGHCYPTKPYPGNPYRPPRPGRNRCKRPGKPIFNPNNPNLPISDQLIIIGDKVVTLPSWDYVVDLLKPNIDLTMVGQGVGMRTVMQAGIIAEVR